MDECRVVWRSCCGRGARPRALLALLHEESSSTTPVAAYGGVRPLRPARPEET